MAVIVRRRATLAGQEVELETYLPAGRLSKDERLRAERLDDVLRERVPVIAEGITGKTSDDQVVRRWYELGWELRKIVDDPSLLSRTDLDAGYVWRAIWQYLPDLLRPTGARDDFDYTDKQHKRKDHLSLCYELSAFQWSEVRWIKRWDDWNQIAFRPGILRDARVLNELGGAISQLRVYPTREEFRSVVKLLGEEFPTRALRDSEVLSREEIQRRVSRAVNRVIPS